MSGCRIQKFSLVVASSAFCKFEDARRYAIPGRMQKRAFRKSPLAREVPQ